MSDNLRDRIAEVMEAHDVNSDCGCEGFITNWFDHMADAVIAALGKRRCERCRKDVPLDGFPDPHPGSDTMRPFCVPCTSYIEWTTS